MNKENFLKQIKQRLNDKNKKEHLNSIKYLQGYNNENEINKLNQELKKNIILNEEI